MDSLSSRIKNYLKALLTGIGMTGEGNSCMVLVDIFNGIKLGRSLFRGLRTTNPCSSLNYTDLTSNLFFIYL